MGAILGCGLLVKSAETDGGLMSDIVDKRTESAQ
jgi:hypothetical protein